MLAALIPVLGPLLGKLLERAFPDPAARAKAEQEFYAALAQADLGQLEINRAEAGHPSLFVAGWRPAIGWVCAGALCWQFLLAPLAEGVGWAFGAPVPPLPRLDGSLWELMFGMLGMGALRSLEKLKGRAGN